jgi:Methyltransferase domain
MCLDPKRQDCTIYFGSPYINSVAGIIILDYYHISCGSDPRYRRCRGDLAVAMAQFFANVHVFIVDVNETSLQAGKDFAEQVMGRVQANRQTNWYCDDFAHFASHYNLYNHNNHIPTFGFDVVVAWHACGDLSDYALEFATQIHASFIICPCCCTKRYIDGFEAQWIGD